MLEDEGVVAICSALLQLPETMEYPVYVEITVMAKVMGSSVCSYLGFQTLLGW
jgi:hypothetical protein